MALGSRKRASYSRSPTCETVSYFGEHRACADAAVRTAEVFLVCLAVDVRGEEPWRTDQTTMLTTKAVALFKSL